MTRLATAVVRLLLCLAPAGFRREFGVEIEAHFRRSIEAEQGMGRLRRVARGWWGVIEVAALEWIDPTSGRAARQHQSTRPRRRG